MFKVIFLLFSFSTFGSQNISYSGRLVQSNGAPISGPVDLTLDIIVNDGASDNVQCTINVTNVSLSNGVFNVELDYATTCASNSKTLATVLSDSAKASHTNYIQITDQTNSKVYTKQKISNTPTALVSLYANSVVNGAISQQSLLGVSANCTAGQVLKTNADGSFYCANDLSGAGTITGVNANAPLSASAGPNVTLSLAAADASTDGYLSSTDWNTFNSKVGLPSGGNTTHYLKGDNSWATLATEVEAIALSSFSPVNSAVTTGDTIKGALEKLQGQISQVTSSMPSSTDDLPQGSTNLYYSATAARADLIANAINDNELTKAPNGEAVYEAMALKQNQITQSDAIVPGRVQVSMQNGITVLPYGTNVGETGEVQFKELISNGADYVGLKAPDALASSFVLTLPNTQGNSGEVLTNNGSGVLGWSTLSGGSLAPDSVNSSKIVDGSIVNADINASAAIDATKLASGSVDNTELSYLNGVTSAIQTQIDSKVAKTTTINGKALSANVTLVTTDVAEGTNLYFTDARAKASAVADSISDAVTNVAPSQNAVFDALALKANASALPNYVAKADLTNCTAADKKLSWNGTSWSCDSLVSLSGDVTGAINSNTVVALQGRAVNSGAPSSNDVLTWNGSAWAPLAVPSSADNLGNHTATQNINLASSKLVGNGGTEGLSIAANGNIGVSTSGALDKLTVSNSFRIRSAAQNNFMAPSTSTTEDFRIFIQDDANNGNPYGTGNNSAIIFENQDLNNPAPDDSMYFVNTGNDNLPKIAMAIKGDGKIGIGKAAPTEILDVNGNVKATGFIGDGSGLTNVSASNTSNIVSTTIGADSDTNGTGEIIFQTGSTAKMTIKNDGKIGIGTSAPVDDFTIKKDGSTIRLESSTENIANSSSIVFAENASQDHFTLRYDGDAAQQGSGALKFNANGVGDVMSITRSGRVGIGTSDPAYPLEVQSSSGLAFSLYRPVNTLNNASGTIFSLNNSAGTKKDYARIFGGIQDNTASAEKGFLSFNVADGSGTWGIGYEQEKMRLTSEGYLGLGTSTPERALHIAGTGGVNDDVLIDSNNDNTASSLLALRKSRGTASAPTQALTNDIIGLVSFRGHDGTAYTNVADIRSIAESDLGTAPSGRLDFLTRNAAGTLAERMTIKGEGDIGIGVTSPTEKFHVAGNGLFRGTTPKLKVQESNHAAGISEIQVGQSDWYGSLQYNSATDVFSIDTYNNGTVTGTGGIHIKHTSGNVGIGTQAASELLDVNGNVKITGDLKMSGSDSYIWTNGTGTGYTGIYDQANSKVLLYTSETNGHVGVGTATPNSKLTVNSNVFTNAPLNHAEGGLLVINGNDFGGIGLLDRDGNSATTNDYSTVLFYGDDLGEDLHLSHWRSGASAFRHDVTIKGETGKVGFGTTNPESIIHVVGGAPYLTWEETDTTQKFYTGVDGAGWWIRQGTTANPDIFTVKNTGFIGINDSTPSAALTVGGNIAASGWVGAGCEGACSTDAYVINYADGRIHTYDGSSAVCSKAGGASTFTCSSDERLKNTVEDFTDGLNYVLQLRPRTYYWNNDDKNILQYGFIAQEVQKVIPHAVSEQERPEGVFLGLDQGAFTPYIINAIHDLDAKIENNRAMMKAMSEGVVLENSRKIASLEKEVDDLKKENQAMKEALCSIKPDLKICE
ncbi:endosialidase chaperone [Bacteriovorax sp. BSW11_IV]|uniref:tail fiber domain-containing protein n=1 Tax=Bacteriovorax sp. BSW11_IV TaxID=1353529 RepID=UPI00038A49F6|nr:tail fiber domain-containing protein [Bacteriovorax sp. BSW11_IV]EQC44518.1 endosialidase chaperone [Bacteriovorax sp. BSW11_IV]